MKRQRYGFTLIELLIVVAIIAILAAIAVPNFLEAQVRTKVGRVKSELRSIALALEAYAVDHNGYPLYQNADDGNHLLSHTHWEATLASYLLTTPVAYTSNLPADPFQAKYPAQESAIYGYSTSSDHDWTYYYRRKFAENTPDWRGPSVTYTSNYRRNNIDKAYDCYHQTGWYLGNPVRGGPKWVIGSPGPDLLFPALQRAQVPQYYRHSNPRDNYSDLRYDPSNGTKSTGDILRFGP